MPDWKPESETLDKLYLEWSQFTTARTSREITYVDALQQIVGRPPIGKPEQADIAYWTLWEEYVELRQIAWEVLHATSEYKP